MRGLRNDIRFTLLIAVCLFIGFTADRVVDADVLEGKIEDRESLAVEAAVKLPLDELFDELVILPYDYQEKVFVRGQLTDIYGEYEIFQREGRVLVPIRLMSYLANELDRNMVNNSGYSGYWQTIWDAEKPNEVQLINQEQDTRVDFQIDNKTMWVNGEARSLDVAPQKINGRIVLPLRSAAEALNVKIDWLDGLIIMGDRWVDLQHPQTQAIKGKVKEILTDSRKRTDGDLYRNLVTKIDGNIFYLKFLYGDDEANVQFVKKSSNNEERVIPLPGTPHIWTHPIIGEELYFVTTIDGQVKLYAYHLIDDQFRQVAVIDDWQPADGWFGGVYELDGELYVKLHFGDLTMGYDGLYRLEQGILKEVAGAKSFINIEKAGNSLIYTDFAPMVFSADNLKRVDLETGEVNTLGESGYVYGIIREISDLSTSYTGDEKLFIKDHALYTIAYKEEDLEDAGAVYRLDLENNTQKKLTGPTRQYELINDHIYYVDAETGYLKRVDLNGEHEQTLSSKHVIEIQPGGEYVYFTAYEKGTSAEAAVEYGSLYRYDLSSGQEQKVSERIVHSFYVGQSGVYYKSDGYEMGLYQVESSGNNTLVNNDRIDSAMMTDEGLIYTLTYEEGVYSTN